MSRWQVEGATKEWKKQTKDQPLGRGLCKSGPDGCGSPSVKGEPWSSARSRQGAGQIGGAR